MNQGIVNLEETEKAVSAPKIILKNADAILNLKADLNMYEIQSFIGTGSSGMVYKAKHKQLGRNVAIKMLHPEYFENPVILENFRKEAQIISRIKHQNVASVYDFIEINNHYYIIMELVEGLNLQGKCNEGGLTEEEILNIMLGLLEGIRFTHMKNILHLDIKPSNIILNEFGDPLIVDFGISNFKGSKVHNNNDQVAGTPFYMAPEQFTKTLDIIDFRADLYSIGVVFYQIVTGKLPFRGETFDEVRRQVLLKEPLQPSLLNKKITPDLEAIILKLIKKNPQARYHDAQSVIDDIKRYQRGEPVKAMKYRRITILYSIIVRNKAISALSFIVLIVLLTFTAYFSYQKHQRTPQWKTVFNENFSDNFSDKWEGFKGMSDGFLEPIKTDEFPSYFMNRIKTLSFKDEHDVVLSAKQSFEKNIRMKFQMNVYPEENSSFGLFINAPSLKNEEYGYIFYFEKNKIYLKRDNILKTNFLWEVPFKFENSRIYNLEVEIVEDNVKLLIDNEKIIDFNNFVTGFTKREYKLGFFSKFTDIEINNLQIFELNKALLITPLDIPDRFFQYTQYEQAINEYTRVINKYPASKIIIEAYYSRGLAYANINKTDKALEDFDKLLSISTDHPLKGKTYYQKAECYLKIGDSNNAFKNFNKAIEIFDIKSLRLVIANSIINRCREKLSINDKESINEALLLFKYITTLNLEEPVRMTFLDVPKSIALFYFDMKEYEKSVEVLNIIIKYYSFRPDVYAFSLWKSGRAYYELAIETESEKGDSELSLNYKLKALKLFKKVLAECSDIRIYIYFSYEELAKVHRSLGNFQEMVEFQKKKNELSDVFF